MIVKFVLTVALIIELTCTVVYAEVTAVDWLSASSGDMDGISVSHSTSFYNFSYDLSGADFAFAPLSNSQETILYSAGSDWTMTFGSAVEGLLLYIYAWRGTDPDNNNNVVPVFGQQNIQETPSALSHWPVQMHLINPAASYFYGTDLLLASDCSAFTAGNFHSKFLKGKTLAIACPKLDSGIDVYISKVKSLIEDAKINTLTVLMMEVPCCGGLLQIVHHATKDANRKIPVKMMIMNIRGEIIKEEWT